MPITNNIVEIYAVNPEWEEAVKINGGNFYEMNNECVQFLI